MKAFIMIILLILVSAGCSVTKRMQTSYSLKESASYPEFYVKYKSWSSSSQGAEITYTSLQFVELDLSKSRIRKFIETASRPDPMLPFGDSPIEKLIAHVPWIELTPEQVSKFWASIQAWLNSNPPSEYNSPITLGEEDGHVTRLTVSLGKKTISTTLNPRGGFREDDPSKPPEEWNNLIELLISQPKMHEDELNIQQK